MACVAWAKSSANGSINEKSQEVLPFAGVLVPPAVLGTEATGHNAHSRIAGLKSPKDLVVNGRAADH